MNEKLKRSQNGNEKKYRKDKNVQTNSHMLITVK